LSETPKGPLEIP